MSTHHIYTHPYTLTYTYTLTHTHLDGAHVHPGLQGQASRQVLLPVLLDGVPALQTAHAWSKQDKATQGKTRQHRARQHKAGQGRDTKGGGYGVGGG